MLRRVWMCVAVVALLVATGCAREELAKKQKEIVALEQQVKALNENLTTLGQQKADADKMVQQLKTENEALKAAATTQQATTVTTQASEGELAKLNEENAALKKEVNTKDVAMAQMKIALDKANAEIASLRGKIGTMAEELKKVLPAPK